MVKGILRVKLTKEEKKFWKPKMEKETMPILESLESQFPNWVFFADLIFKHASESLIRTNKKIDLLIGNGLIERELEIAPKQAIIEGKRFDIQIPKFRITPKGLDLLNNLGIKKLNKQIARLTSILLLLTFILVILGIIQILVR